MHKSYRSGRPLGRARVCMVRCSDRRTVDVLVIGGGALAQAASISLARKGKRVVMVPSFGIQPLVSPTMEVTRPLCLPNSSPLMASLCSESSLYWQGLQSQMGGQDKHSLFEPCPTLDLFLSQGQESGLEEEIGLIRASSSAAGIKVGSLKGKDLSNVFPLLRLDSLSMSSPRYDITGLVQPSGGGIIDSSIASGFLFSTALRLGVKLKENSRLSGWSDRGDHFLVDVVSSFLAKDEIVGYETEQIVLAPQEEDWPGECFRLFGLDLADKGIIRLNEKGSHRAAASSDLARLPLTRFWESSSSWSFAVFPKQSPESSVKISSPPSIDLSAPPLSAWTNAKGKGTGPKGTGTDLNQTHRQIASDFIRGMSSLPDQVSTSSLCVSTPDGLPIVGFHSGYESGRILVACSSSASSSEQKSQMLGDGFLLAPLLARLSADLVTGSAFQDVSPALIDLHRPSLVEAGSQSTSKAVSKPRGAVDTLSELHILQRGLDMQKTKEEKEEEEDMAEEKRKGEKAA
jgi:glycine/D-amino acid oxidase-like deaminating enzyme